MTDEPIPVVRAAGPDDADAIAAVGARAWELTYRGIVPDVALDSWIAVNPAAWRDLLADVAADDPGRTWVADRGGTVIGYATTSPGKDTWLPPPPGAGEVTNLYLDPDVIGTGVGSLLYRHAVADLAARGFDPLVVWAFRDNTRAVAFYGRMGLEIDVPDGTWMLADVPCPIVRFRGPLASAPDA